MKKSTLLGFSFVSLVIATGTFWWGVLYGRGLATSDLEKGRNTDSIKLLGNSGEKARNINGSADATIERNDSGNERSVDEVVAEAMSFDLEGLSPTRMAKAFDLFKELDQRELPAALKLIESEESGQTKRLQRMGLLSRWAEFDGPGAADYVLENPGDNPEGRTMDHQGMVDLQEIISTWSERDPEAAFEWLISRADEVEESGFTESHYLTTIFKALSLRNGDEAFAKLESLESDQSRISAMSGMMISSQDVQRRGELMEKLQAIDDPNMRDVGYQRLVSEWAFLSPEEAATFVETASDLEASTVEILTNDIVRAWMEDNPEEGAEWLIETATDENRSARIKEVVNKWLEQDPNAAAHWLAGFEPSVELDEALLSLSTRIIERDGEASFEWAARITDDNTRNEALKNTFQRWYFQDSENAKAHLQASDVPSDQSTEWIDEIESRIKEIERRTGRLIER